MRLFLAVELPAPIRSRLADLQRDLSGKLKRVDPENIHVTVKFLGEVAADRVGALREALDNPGLAPFDVEARGLGVFPHPGSPRVVWVGVGRGAENFVQLSRLLDQRLAPLGFPREKRFVPHATLARVKFLAGPERAQLRELVEGHRETTFGEWRAGEVVLKRSDLTPSGPVYSDVARFVLKGANP